VGGGRRLHPAVFTLVAALAKRDLSILADPERIAAMYGELGFRLSLRSAFLHRGWLLANGYIVIVRGAEGEEVWLAERGLELARRLGLDGGLPAAPARGARR
jgi:hypothetical protein